MRGYLRAQDALEQERQQQDQLAARKKELGARASLDLLTRLQSLDDPVEFEQFKGVIGANADAFGIDPQAFAGVSFPESKAQKKRIKELSAEIEKVEKSGVDVHDPAMADYLLKLPDGQTVRFGDAIAATRPRLTDPSGQAVRPPKKADVNASTDYGRFLAKWAKDRGKTVESLSAQDELDAKKAFNTVDDKPTTGGTASERAAGILKQIRDAEASGNKALAATLKLGYADLLKAERELGSAGRKPDAPVPAGTLSPNVQRRVDAKAKAFDSQPAVKRTQMLAEAVAFAQGLNIDTQNPADDQALIYAFAKAMDPDSVVREGEYATVQKYAQSWAQSMGFNAARIFSNTPFLTRQARQNMKATIQARFGAGRSQYDNLRRSYADQINRITGGTNGDDYLVDYGGAFPAETSGPAVGERRKFPNGQVGEWDGKGWLPVVN